MCEWIPQWPRRASDCLTRIIPQWNEDEQPFKGEKGGLKGTEAATVVSVVPDRQVAATTQRDRGYDGEKIWGTAEDYGNRSRR